LLFLSIGLFKIELSKMRLKIMSRVIDAIFENGVFKPLERIDLKEHEKVTIIVTNEGEPQQKECILDGIIDIASNCTDTDLSVHHDKYLYGKVSD
jgi:predicted DNA-binding antitoxin AbrB/MazE fold protein